ncbi:MAG: 2-phospho-L-lactate transferase CofD family protein [Nanoarchaeota archaeon]
MNGTSTITLIGGGRGLHTVATGFFKYHDLDLAAIVCNAQNKSVNPIGILPRLFDPVSSIRETVQRIICSDLIVVCPGRLHSETIPLLASGEITKALKEDIRGNCVYLCMLTTPYDPYIVSANDVVREIERHTSPGIFNYVLYQNPKPYGEKFPEKRQTRPPTINNCGKTIYVGSDLLDCKKTSTHFGDTSELLSHDPLKTARALYQFIKSQQIYYYSSGR